MDPSTSMDVTDKDSTHRPHDSPSRHSPAPPLAPLEYLQNQRRGSITDPSLHAASPNHQNPALASSSNSSGSTLFRHQEFPHPVQSHPSSNSLDPQSKNPQLTTRPVSPYIFGDASVQPTDPSNPQARRLLHNASAERGNGGEMPQSQNGQHAKRREDDMDTDSTERPTSLKPPVELVTSNIPGQPSNFDYNMRRHSVPGGEPGRTITQGVSGQSRGSPVSPASQAGAKRKMSSDRGQLPAVGEEIDPQLVGPGTHTTMPVDPEEPAPKRRSSAFDTQRIAQLSLYDRRDSLDSRMSGTPSWWTNERRDSTSSMFSSTSMASSVGFNSPAFSGEVHGRQPGSMSTFAWPPNTAPGDPSEPPGVQAPVDPTLARQFESQAPPHSALPPPNMPVDRRMSVPDAMPSTSANRPERTLRARSRPPSRTAAAVRASEASAGSPNVSPGGANIDDSPSSASPSANLALPMKELGSTPYSRSPELRVSHKLAERKRRKEMRDLFDELRDQLPADRGMKASKWEILSKAIDFIQQMKQTHSDMAREIDMLRHELDSVRHVVPFGHPGAAPHAAMYGPPQANAQYSTQGAAGHPGPAQQPLSRPGSSQNTFAPSTGAPQAANGKT